MKRSALIAAALAAAALLSVTLSSAPAATHAAGRTATVATASSSVGTRLPEILATASRAKRADCGSRDKALPARRHTAQRSDDAGHVWRASALPVPARQEAGQDERPGLARIRRRLVRALTRRQEDREGMNSTPQVSGTILAISGSLRRSSINSAVLRAAAAAAARDGALIVVDDSVRELPHFDPDLEIEPTEAVLRFRAHVRRPPESCSPARSTHSGFPARSRTRWIGL